MPAAVRKRPGFRAVRGCLLITACLGLATGAALLAQATEPATTDSVVEAIPPPVPDEWKTEFSDAISSCTSCTGGDCHSPGGRFYVDYDRGFAILPRDPDETPYSLRIRNQNMFRYDGFSRAESSWTDSAGNVIPITNSNYFGIPRGRLIFSGNALMPRLSYLLNVDYNSVTSQPIGFRAF